MGIFKGQSNKPELYISANSHFEGNIATENDARIDGDITGDITAMNGTVFSGSGSVITGNIYAKDTCLGGVFNGNAYCTGEFAAEGTAEIKGDIFASAMALDAGAKYSGMVTLGPNVVVPKTTDAPADAEEDEEI